MTPLMPPPPLSGAPLHPCPEVTWETASDLFYTGVDRMRHIRLTLLCAKSVSLTFQVHQAEVYVQSTSRVVSQTPASP